MPFDGVGTRDIEAHLLDLRDLLRDRSRWPPDFVWDYRRTDGCALGLLARIGRPGWLIREAIGPRDTQRIFSATWGLIFGRSPERVARTIDRVVARHRRRYAAAVALKMV